MLVAVAATHAQTPTATLSHEGTVKCFYGADAFVNAVAEAADGDMITLSSGYFPYAVDINTAIKIKGAGMTTDTINCVEQTITGSIRSTKDVTIEGVYMTTFYNSEKSANTKLIKCTILSSYSVGTSGSQSNPNNHYLINCKSLKKTGCGQTSYLHILNSFVVGLGGHYLDVKNSIVKDPALYTQSYGTVKPLDIWDSSFINCIFSLIDYPQDFSSSNYIYYSIGTNQDGSIFDNVIGYDDGSGNYVPNNTNTVVSDLSTVFKTFNGQNYNEYETFELTNSAQTTYLGDDGTQVGMYGGSMPYNPFPSHPIITKCTVAEKSTPQGTLSVDIEVKPAQ